MDVVTGEVAGKVTGINRILTENRISHSIALFYQFAPAASPAVSRLRHGCITATYQG